jgi:hypothetical protein
LGGRERIASSIALTSNMTERLDVPPVCRTLASGATRRLAEKCPADSSPAKADREDVRVDCQVSQHPTDSSMWLPGTAAATASRTFDVPARMRGQLVVERTTTARRRPLRFCWYLRFLSVVSKTSNP